MFLFSLIEHYIFRKVLKTAKAAKIGCMKKFVPI